MDRATILASIDHTVLKAEALLPEIEKAAHEAREYSFASVCANPCYVATLASLLEGSAVKVCTVVGFPLGANMAGLKAREAELAVGEGAQEIDMVAHLPDLLSQNEAALIQEIALVTQRAKAAGGAGVIVKVIVESAALLKDVDAPTAEARIATACRAVKEGGADFIKTSTGFHPAGGASVEAVRWMVRYADGLKVKASGGVRDLAAAKEYLELGASRLGTSSGVAIAQGLAGESAY